MFVDGKGGRLLDLFNLYSDSPASIGVTILAGAAARGSTDRPRAALWLLAAALGVYSVGNLLHSTYWLFGIDPSVGRRRVLRPFYRACSRRC